MSWDTFSKPRYLRATKAATSSSPIPYLTDQTAWQAIRPGICPSSSSLMRWKLPFSNISFSLSASCVLSHTYDMRFDSKTYIQIENPHRRHNHSNPASLTTVPPLAQFRRQGRATSYKKRCDGMGNQIASSHTTTEPIASCPARRHGEREADWAERNGYSGEQSGTAPTVWNGRASDETAQDSSQPTPRYPTR